jgi:iron(III) transport system ATP-binding protein
MSDAARPGLTVERVQKRFGTVDVLRGVDLVVEPATLTAVLGPSGCGKTTLLRIIAGFEACDAGRVLIRDRDVTGLPPERRTVGVVPQEGALFPHLDVAGNVGFGLHRSERAEKRDRIATCLAMVGLTGFERHRPDQLSGGQQQRVALARALAPRPALLLLDEPFAALDANLRAQIRDELAAVVRASNTTTVLVTHDRDEALSVADRVAVMLDGVIAQTAVPSELYRHPTSAGVAEFIGEVTLLPGRRVGGAIEATLAMTSSSGPEGDVLFVVRPEQVVLGNGGPEMTVTAVRYFGHDCLVDLTDLDGVKLIARVPGHRVPQVGGHVHVQIEGDVSAVAR